MKIFGVAIAGLAWALSACQRDERPRTVEADAPITIRLGYLRIGSDLPFFVGQERGIFAKHGLTVVPVRLGDSNLAMEALKNGSIDATDLIGSSVVASTVLERPDLLWIFTLSEATGETNIHRLISRRGSGVTRVADLPGRRLAVFPGSQMRAYVRLFLTKHLAPADVGRVELVPLTPPQQVQAVRDGSVDAVLTLEPTGSQLVVESLGTAIMHNVLYENISKPQPFVTAFGTIRREWANANPGGAAALVSAYQEIADLIQREPGLAREIMAKSLELDSAVVAQTAVYNYRVAPALDSAVVRSTFQLMIQEGVLTALPASASLIVSDSALHRWSARE